MQDSLPAEAMPGTPPPDTTPIANKPAPRASWWRAGVRVLAFRAPQLQGLDAKPVLALVLLLAGYLFTAALQWGMAQGEPQWIWQGFLRGWAGTALMVWLCWVVACSQGTEAKTPVGTLWVLLAVSALQLNLAMAAPDLVLNSGFGLKQPLSADALWALWLLPALWLTAAQIRLLWRVAGTRLAELAALLLVPASVWLHLQSPPVFWWTPPSDVADETASESEEQAVHRLTLTDAVLDAQSRMLSEQLAALDTPSPERVNVYALTYAPYASENVFMNESAAVAKTLRERFGAEGRLVELVVNPDTATRLPWATPLNLKKSIAHMASLMDRERDLLFIHLTSHGGADGKLATDTWPLQTEEMTPALLRAWLDEAGVRWRVISVSACYSGSWIAPLAGDDTLVMTAADATHTSYGCGRKSPITFFGQAMYVEALQQTRSFSTAHAQARQLIEAREKTAGKTDGYSNPQLSEGAGIRAQLLRLEQELARP